MACWGRFGVLANWPSDKVSLVPFAQGIRSAANIKGVDVASVGLPASAEIHIGD